MNSDIPVANNLRMTSRELIERIVVDLLEVGLASNCCNLHPPPSSMHGTVCVHETLVKVRCRSPPTRFRWASLRVGGVLLAAPSF